MLDHSDPTDPHHRINKTMIIKAFVTSSPSIHNGMNFLGISPGPYLLKDYTFFHQFQPTFFPNNPYTHMRSLRLNVSIEDGF